MSNPTEVTIEQDNVYKSNDKIYVGKFSKEWIKTPPELGSKKLKVVDEFQTMCNCGNHTTTLYILEKDYFTIYCNTRGWAWLKQPPNREMIYNLKINK
jgi:hypothetical protein